MSRGTPTIDYDILDACLKSHPARPTISPAAMPYTQEQLDELIDYCMWLCERLKGGVEPIQGEVIPETFADRMARKSMDALKSRRGVTT